MIYTIDEIKKIINPIAEKYDIKELYIFGSYARGDATEESDIDLLVDRENSKIKSIFDLSGFRIDCVDALNKEVDIVTVQSLEQKKTKETSYIFISHIMKERIKLYDRERLPGFTTHKTAL